MWGALGTYVGCVFSIICRHLDGTQNRTQIFLKFVIFLFLPKTLFSAFIPACVMWFLFSVPVFTVDSAKLHPPWKQ
jgi:hypothetical protein